MLVTASGDEDLTYGTWDNSDHKMLTTSSHGPETSILNTKKARVPHVSCALLQLFQS